MRCMCAGFSRLAINASRLFLVFGPASAANYTNARQVCINEGGELATLFSAQEASTLYTELVCLKADTFTAWSSWIGLATRNFQRSTNVSDWVWLSTGQNPPWSAWATGEPNNQNGLQGICGGMIVKTSSGTQRRWDDGTCSNLQTFTCEIGALDSCSMWTSCNLM